MNTFLFDLDGTLLPMDQEKFINGYLKYLCKKFVPMGFDQEQLVKAVWLGTDSMCKNDGTVTNCEVFWKAFGEILGSDIRTFEPDFESFYQNEFQSVIHYTTPSPLAKDAISLLKSKGYHLALATNPLFPTIATESRVKWAGLNPNDFSLITTYETSSYCKPNPKYYEEILQRIGKQAPECCMVGNDVSEDMVTAALGLDTYLITDCLINSNKEDISAYKKGSFVDFMNFIRELPSVSI